MFKAAIFDMDGTLVDSMDAWHAADTAFLTKRGLPVEQEYLDAVKRMHFRLAAEYTIDRYALHGENPDDIIDEWRGYVRHAYDETIPAKPGALDYLRELKANGVKLALATSSEPELCGGLLRRLGLDALIDATVYTREAARPKGFPDVYLLAAERLGVAPADAAVFEDILAGVRAAKQGGFTAAAVYDESSSADWDAMCAEADFSVKDFRELLK